MDLLPLLGYLQDLQYHGTGLQRRSAPDREGHVRGPDIRVARVSGGRRAVVDRNWPQVRRAPSFRACITLGLGSASARMA